MTAGYIFSKVCSRGGLNVFTVTEYPSLIRGGHNIYHVRVEERELTSQIALVDLLVALNKETIDLHKGELTRGGAIVYDEGTKLEEGEVRPDVLLYPIPLQRYAREIGEAKVMMNSVALGASVALVDYDLDLLAQVTRETFGGKKGEEIADANIKAAKAGYDYIREHFKPAFGHRLRRVDALRRMLVNGNEAMAIGNVLETVEDLRVGAEPLHTKGDDDARDPLDPSELHERTDSTLGFFTLLGPVLA